MDALAPWHLIIVAAAFVVFFGWKQLPDMSRSLGRSLRIFKTEIKGPVEEAAPAITVQPTATSPALVHPSPIRPAHAGVVDHQD